MVQVRQVGMAVRHRRMLVPVRVGLRALAAVMRVLVVLVVNMAMNVVQALVPVLVRVPLREHQPRCGEHQPWR